jgi:aspartate/methionine/tyrosine aminotransferase
MGFESNDYLEWYIPRAHGSGAVNLHSSGVAALDPAGIEVPDVDPWLAPGLFEGALASWLGVGAGEIAFTPGATGGTLLALMTLTSPGDDIVVELPVYEPMLRQAMRLGEVRRLRRRKELGWRFDPEEIASVMTGRTSLVMITEPGNPSGTFLPRDEVLGLASAAAERGAVLLVNEVYLGYTSAPSYHGAARNIVVVSSLSKLLGPYWARLGWLGAEPGTASRLRAAHRNMSIPTSPGAAFGLGVLARADELRDRARGLASGGLGIVDAWVGATDGVGWTRPEGTGFGCVELPGVEDDVAFAERLEGEGALVVPGAFFEVPGTIRLSWLQAGDRLEEGLSIIAGAL